MLLNLKNPPYLEDNNDGGALADDVASSFLEWKSLKLTSSILFFR